MIVALETSSTDLSIAAADDDGSLLFEDGWSAGYRHASELLPRLLERIGASGHTLRDTRLVVVGDGPGSFTGLRVGMSVAKAIAVAVSCPVVARPSLVAWLAAEPGAAVALSRAGSRESYLLERDDTEPSIVPHEGLADRLRGGGVVAPRDLSSVVGIEESLPPFRAAGALVRAAAAALDSDHPQRSEDAAAPASDLDAIEPRYVRAPRGLDAGSAAER